MKKLTFILLAFTFVLVSFSPQEKTRSSQQYYIYVYAYEHDKQLEEAEDWDSHGVFITTNIVSVSCDFLSEPGVEIQFDEFYEGEQGNDNRKLYGYGFTFVGLYDTYDEAYASRREAMAKTDSKNKRRIETFHVTCD